MDYGLWTMDYGLRTMDLKKAMGSDSIVCRLPTATFIYRPATLCHTCDAYCVTQYITFLFRRAPHRCLNVSTCPRASLPTLLLM
jgi:hypothetical protein